MQILQQIITLLLATHALTANTTGALKMAVGNYALDANTTADYNNAFGYQALSANTSRDMKMTAVRIFFS